MVWQNECWLADHCLGPFGVGALALKTKVHRGSLPELSEHEATTLGAAIRALSHAMVHGLPCETVYVSAWVDRPPLHVHFVLEPQYGDEAGLGSWELQARRRKAGPPPPGEAAAAADRIRTSLSSAEHPDRERRRSRSAGQPAALGRGTLATWRGQVNPRSESEREFT